MKEVILSDINYSYYFLVGGRFNRKLLQWSRVAIFRFLQGEGQILYVTLDSRGQNLNSSEKRSSMFILFDGISRKQNNLLSVVEKGWHGSLKNVPKTCFLKKIYCRKRGSSFEI